MIVRIMTRERTITVKRKKTPASVTNDFTIKAIKLSGTSHSNSDEESKTYSLHPVTPVAEIVSS